MDHVILPAYSRYFRHINCNLFSLKVKVIFFNKQVINWLLILAFLNVTIWEL